MSDQFERLRYDAIVIGARCAGAATAMLLARQGARVLMVDRATEIGDTLSTHALMRPAVTLLDRWDILDSLIAAGTPPVTMTQFVFPDQCIDIDVKPSGRAKGLYAPRRWLLDKALCTAAVKAGVEFRAGISFAGVEKDQTGRVIGARLRQRNGDEQCVFATTLIGADGRRSAVAEAVGAKTIRTSPTCSATVYTYVDGLPNEGYRWYYGNGMAAGLIPTTDGQHCFFASCAPRDFKAWFGGDAFGGAVRMLSEWAPEIAADLAGRGSTERLRRFAGAPGHIRDCAGDGWALVGDAGYFKDPATAHGITDALLDAHRLSQALGRREDARAYQTERDRFAMAFFPLTQDIASLDWSFDELRAMHAQLARHIKREGQSLEPATRSLVA